MADQALGDSLISGMTPEEWQLLMAQSGGMPPVVPPAGSSVTDPLTDTLRSGAQAVVGALNAAGGYLGIPQGEIKNAQGDVVFPTNALERGLQSGSEPTKDIAAAVMGPGHEPMPMKSPLPILPGDIRASVRFPTGVKATENPLTQHLNIGLPEMRASPGYEHNVGLLSDYPGFARLKGMSADEAAQTAIEQMRGNLNYLYTRAPETMQERSPLWYAGANRIAGAMADRWGVPKQSAAGGIAALSPQKDWFQNASLAERTGDILFGPASSRPMTSDMNALGRAIPSLQSPANIDIFRSIQGKALSHIDDPLGQAMWVRLYDEAHNPKFYRTITPEGNYGEFALNKGGEPSSVGWGSGGEVAKAIAAMKSGGDMNIISPSLGYANKVRSFYNNIAVPNDPRFGDVTIDTHQVAGAQLRPLSGKAPAVAHNFANSLAVKDQPPGYVGASGSALTGLQGTYPIYAEATRLAARDQGLVPRAGQSATWEPVRELFPDTFKTAKNAELIDSIWRSYDRGELNIDQARRAVFDAAGGIGLPSWARSGAATYAPERSSTYRGDLPYSVMEKLYGRTQRGGAGGLPTAPSVNLAAPGSALFNIIRKSSVPAALSVAGIAASSRRDQPYNALTDHLQQ